MKEGKTDSNPELVFLFCALRAFNLNYYNSPPCSRKIVLPLHNIKNL